MNSLKRLVYLGVNKDDQSLEGRSCKLCNQVNIYVGLIMSVLLVFLFVMSRIENAPMGIGTLRVALVIVLTIINLALAIKGYFSIARLLTIFFLPFLMLIFPTLIGFVEAESFTYYPILVIAFSVLPHILLIPYREKLLYRISIAYMTVLIIFIDRFLLWFLTDPMVIVNEIATFYPYYKMGHIGSYVFVQLSLLYLRRVNFEYENTLELAFKKLKKSSSELEKQNKALQDTQTKLQRSNEELNNAQVKLKGQNAKLSNTLNDLKQTHDKLLQSEKMAALGTLTAGVAHEINNPLNYIAGGAGLLETEMDYVAEQGEQLTEKDKRNLIEIIKKSLKMINAGVKKTTGIVRSLGAYSYQGTSELEQTDIHKVIDSGLQFLQSKINNSVEIVRKYELEEVVPIHKNKMHQVILNLLDNSIFEAKKLKQSAIVEIKTLRVNRNDKQWAKIIINNTGAPIPEEVLNKIFDPFFTTKEVGVGTGLGLSISHAIVKEHNGDIQLANTDSGVSTVIHLPLEQ